MDLMERTDSALEGTFMYIGCGKKISPGNPRKTGGLCVSTENVPQDIYI